jgi:hypothetical protein
MFTCRWRRATAEAEGAEFGGLGKTGTSLNVNGRRCTPTALPGTFGQTHLTPNRLHPVGRLTPEMLQGTWRPS